MSYTRVSQSMLVSQVMSNLNSQTRKLMDLQNQLSTGQCINAPSDDPIGARTALNSRKTIQKNEQYVKNIALADPILNDTSSTLDTVINILQRAEELTVQGSTGTNSQDDLDYIALEVNELVEMMVDSGNHVTNGRYIFGGTCSLDEAFTATTDATTGEITAVTYNGNSEKIEMQVSDRTSVAINETGDAVFQDSEDIFQVLINIRDNLRSGDQTALGSNLTDLENAQSQVLSATARVGATQNRLETMTSQLEDYISNSEELLSLTIDIDYADVYVDLSAQENAYQAALSAASQVLQPSLLDFLS